LCSPTPSGRNARSSSADPINRHHRHPSRSRRTASLSLTVIDGLTNRVEEEGDRTHRRQRVRRMELQFDNKTSNPVYAPDDIHTNQSIFSFGISITQGIRCT
jgi:hypothetical protein